MVDNRSITHDSARIDWTSRDGSKRLAVIVSLIEHQERHVVDGVATNWTRARRDAVRIEYRAEIDGIEHPSLHNILPLAQPQEGAVARIGQIGLTAERVTLVEAAAARFEQHPVWQQYQADVARAARQCDEYERGQQRVLDAMTLGGRSL